MDDIIEIARTMRDRSCARTLAGTCKEILGTCRSVGCTVDHEDPEEVTRKVTYDVCTPMVCHGDGVDFGGRDYDTGGVRRDGCHRCKKDDR